MTEGTSLTAIAPTTQGRMTRIRERLLPTEANMRRHMIQMYCGMMGGTGIAAAANLLTAIPDIHFLGGGFGIMIATISTASGVFGKVTPRIDPQLRSSFRRTIDSMISIGTEGIEDPDRIEVEKGIADMASAIEAMMGVPAWRLAPTNVRISMPTHLEARVSHLFVMRERWVRQLGDPTGASTGFCHTVLPILVQLVIGISDEFGLDTSPLQRPKGDLPGRNRTLTVMPRQDDPTPTSRARVLAAEWLAGDREQVDILVRLEADAASGRDLRRLEEAWLDARRAATGDVSDIDRKFEQGADRLAEIIQEAIDLRAETAMQTLDTHVRYAHAKRVG